MKILTKIPKETINLILKLMFYICDAYYAWYMKRENSKWKQVDKFGYEVDDE